MTLFNDLAGLSVFYPVFFLVISFILGAVMGSALNCLAYRLAHGKKWEKGRSACVECGHTLGVLDLVPIFSYIFLGGRCRWCKSKISPRYLVTELVLAFSFALITLFSGLSYNTLSALVLAACLLALSLVDLDVQIIPDRFIIIPIIARLIVLFLEGGFMGLLKGFIPAFIFGGALLVISLVMDKLLKKEAMGGGDIKLMFALGLYFDIPECLLLLLIACIAGLILAAILKTKKGEGFPFGPALSMAALPVLLFGEKLVAMYLNLFS